MKKILFVDDNEKSRVLISRTLGNEHHILQADSGQQAIDVSIKEVPDLIIMDIKMPGKVDGLGATRIIKSNPKLKHCHILVLTAMRREEDIDSAYNSGADDYLVKPFSPTSLIEKVETALKS